MWDKLEKGGAEGGKTPDTVFDTSEIQNRKQSMTEISQWCSVVEAYWTKSSRHLFTPHITQQSSQTTHIRCRGIH